ncbi:NAD(P)-dependent alcohol dehydrogenase [Corallococcus sicarius]|uniref:NAD(P)-dependent alcohol dehydrogenase n=1 Tax=Corallococcus sicarius TaxID=2316726 RepID=A0A3A8MCX3_9BACT|nr:NAD(P)-dependent alcohol dehydrogenase [Corallococcus sicarius]RKH30258.1 NAD(P)-dependent alcohol dehydrogenase [Corallococcus sicarius]
MPTTQAYAAPSAKAALGPFSLERRAPRAQDVLIDILYCGVCHSDIHQARDEWGGAVFPMVPGHEIVGKVSQVGSAVTAFKVGDSVGVGCFVNSCRECPACVAGEEQYCEQGMVSTYNGRERDGTPTYGGYSTSITVDAKYVLRIPEGLPLDRAAPLLCAGITTYSPLHHYGLKAGQKLAVVGLGGLGHMGVKLGKAMGAEVTVLSTSPSKRDDALALGATHFAATSDKQTFKKLANQFDFILDTVSAPHDYNAYLGLLKLDGTMILVGVPETPTPLAAFPLVMKRRKLGGSLIGGIRETQEMLDFCAKHNVASDVEVIPIQKINEAYERMLKGDVRYRFVIDTASLRTK